MRNRHKINPDRFDELAQRWLESERRGNDSAAEGVLERLVQELPRSAPSLGFAHRTLHAAGVLRRRRRSFSLRSVGLGAAVYAGAVLMMGSLLLAGAQGAFSGWLDRFFGEGSLAFALGRTLEAVWSWLANGIELWEQTLVVSGALRDFASLPQVTPWLVLTLFLVALATWCLSLLLRSGRTLNHAYSSSV